MIGVFGGTFDPVHFGHLRCALEVRELLQCDEVRMIPCNVPPHRAVPVASAQERMHLLSTAISTEPGLVLDTREIERDGPSYMVDTLQSIRQESGDEPLCLILGGDAFNGLPGWSRWRRLIELAHLVVMRRPDWEPLKTGELTGFIGDYAVAGTSELRDAPAGRLVFCDVTQLDISATRIRELLASGRNPRYLLPDSVLGEIVDKRLYTVPAGIERVSGLRRE